MSAVIERALKAEMARADRQLRESFDAVAKLMNWNEATTKKWYENPRLAIGEAIRLLTEAAATYDEVREELDVHLAASKL